MKTFKFNLTPLLNIGFVILLAILTSCAAKTPEEKYVSEQIVLNQLGFYPEGKKVAVIKGATENLKFNLVSTKSQEIVYTGEAGKIRTSPYSQINTQLLDFSSFGEPGEYYIEIPGKGRSYSFEIKPGIFHELTKGAIKSYYFQRMSMTLGEKFAGKWARDAGHPDTVVFIHSSAATENRPEGTVISAPFGWYDAGDYNKYIVNSGITMGTLLSLYEDFPGYFENYKVHIPEGNNNVPDLLDEVLWNLKWMLAMQDPDDGGVYHKLTAASFEGMVIPSDAKAKRYVVQKSTTATLDFAAVMAQASRVYSQYEEELPGLSGKFLDAAIRAWDWAQENPDVLYKQDEMNRRFEPPVTTGAYGDKNGDDEFVWAAVELCITTGENKFLNDIDIISDKGFSVPGWGNVRAMGLYTFLRHAGQLNNPELTQSAKSQLLKSADNMIVQIDKNAYGVVMGNSRSDFVWGSNSVAANQGMALIQAFKLTGDQKYIDAAITNLDYLLGRNATGYSFVTGFGDKTPMHPHHRPSVADDIIEPVPGFLVGGPNPGQQDKCDYPSDIPDESYVDQECSYASNEVAINWNAPLVYLAGAIEALNSKTINN